MILSHEKKLILFSPWKTASSTAFARLQPFDEWSHPRWYHFDRRLNRVVHHHITCVDFLAYPEAELPYLKGSFVRNPYDRVYSGFVQLQRDLESQPRSAFENDWVRAHVASQLSDNLAQLRAADFDFNAWFASVREEQVYEAGRNSSFPLHPAHYWTHFGSERYVDVIGRVERFEEDFRLLLERCGIESTSCVNANVSEAPKQDNQGSYRYLHLMSRSTIDKINYLFRNDFELFAYERA